MLLFVRLGKRRCVCKTGVILPNLLRRVYTSMYDGVQRLGTLRAFV